MKHLEENINDWLKNHLKINSMSGFCVGVSGGVDSGVLVGLLHRNKFNYSAYHFLFHNDVVSNPVIKYLIADGCKIVVKDLSRAYNSLYEIIFDGVKDSFEDALFQTVLKAKLGNISLHYEAKKRKFLVPGTINKDEFSLGYFVKNISTEDILPFADIPKMIVRELGKYIGYPDELMEIKASGCVNGSIAEKEWKITEENVYDILSYHFENINGDVFRRYNELNINSKHKRYFPPVFKL